MQLVHNGKASAPIALATATAAQIVAAFAPLRDWTYYSLEVDSIAVDGMSPRDSNPQEPSQRGGSRGLNSCQSSRLTEGRTLESRPGRPFGTTRATAASLS